jgi:large subunit ribosomal protein L13
MEQKIITINAEGEVLGRLASRVALLLQGKNLAEYAPNKAVGSKIKVINISKIKFTGKKYKEKVYKRHTGYLGHLKTKKISVLFEKRPEEVFKRVVSGMLPKNRLLKERLKKLITVK